LAAYDPEYLLLNEHEFGKVMLRNQTLSWKNVPIELPDLKGKTVVHPNELSPDLLYNESHPVKDQGGNKVKNGFLSFHK